MLELCEIDECYRLHHKGLKYWVEVYNKTKGSDKDSLFKAERCTVILLRLIKKSPAFKAHEDKAIEALKMTKINYRRVMAEWKRNKDISG